jgi:hypothetical protein
MNEKQDWAYREALIGSIEAMTAIYADGWRHFTTDELERTLMAVGWTPQEVARLKLDVA